MTRLKAASDTADRAHPKPPVGTDWAGVTSRLQQQWLGLWHVTLATLPKVPGRATRR